MSSLVEHAEYELRRAGLLDEDSDYTGMLGSSILELVKLFSTQGHSGGSAAAVINILPTLLAYEPLTPLTYEPDEWYRHEGIGKNGGDLWQNIRDSRVFSNDGGRTHYQV